MATIMLRDLDDDFVVQVKELTGEGTASKAFVIAAKMAFQLQRQLTRENENTEHWFQVASKRQQLLDALVPAMKEALELAGQGDLFTSEKGENESV